MTIQTTLAEVGGRTFDPHSSRLIRTSWLLNSKATLTIQDPAVQVRFMSETEAARIQEIIRQKHVFSRHSYERSFYVTRAGELGGCTVVEVTLPGDPKSMITEARRIAAAVEAIAVVSTVLYRSRRSLHTDLGITAHRRDVVDLTLGPKLGHLSASSSREAPVRGVTLDKRFVNRFRRLELSEVVSTATDSSHIAVRIQHALLWMMEARLDTGTPAAAIKCAVALETLLGRSDNEPLRATLSERAAFLLSDNASTRRDVSKLIKAFYDARSAIVHGATRRKNTGLTVSLLEATERIVLLLLLTLACNREHLAGDDALAAWIDGQRWGVPSSALRRSFRPGDLKRALERGAK